MGCGESKAAAAADPPAAAPPQQASSHTPPPSSTTAPVGVLKTSKYDSNRSNSSDEDSPNPLKRQGQQTRVSFKAAIQQQLAVQALASAGEAFREGQEAHMSEASKEKPERESTRKKSQLERSSEDDLAAANATAAAAVNGAAKLAVFGGTGKGNSLLKKAIQKQVAAQVVQKAGARYREGQEAELSEAERDRPPRESGRDLKKAAAGASTPSASTTASSANTLLPTPAKLGKNVFQAAIKRQLATQAFGKAVEHRYREGQEAMMAEPERDRPGRQSSRSAAEASRQAEANGSKERDLVESVVRSVSWSASQAGGSASIKTADDNRSRCRLQLQELMQRKRTHLDLSSMGITDLPPEFASLAERLTTLDLSNNQLRKLPHVVCQCTTLEDLRLRSNALVDLPLELSALKRLVTLSLDSNMLEGVPSCVLSLPKLEALHLESNRISSLPASLFATRLDGSGGLVDLRCDHNPIATPPLDVLGGGVAATRAWFKDKEGLDC